MNEKEVEVFCVAPDSGVLMQRERSAHREWNAPRRKKTEHLNEQSSLRRRKLRVSGTADRQRSFIGVRHQPLDVRRGPCVAADALR
jgi:hypothetical protein